MNKSRLVTSIGIVSVAVIVAVSLPLTSVKAESMHEHPTMHKHHENDHDHDHDKMDMKEHGDKCVLTLEKIHAKLLPMISDSVEKAIRAIESGSKETALTELYKAQRMLAAIKKGIAKNVNPKFVNSKCPIYLTPIKPGKVTDDLTREYKGQKVAFCCSNCLPKWDKLSNAQKDSKLARVKFKPAEEHHKHKMH